MNKKINKSELYINSMIDFLNRIENGFLFIRNKDSVKEKFLSFFENLKDIKELERFEMLKLIAIRDSIIQILNRESQSINFFYKQNFFCSHLINGSILKIEENALFVIFNKNQIEIISDKEDFSPSIIIDYLLKNFMLEINDIDVFITNIRKNSITRYQFINTNYFIESESIKNMIFELKNSIYEKNKLKNNQYNSMYSHLN